MKHIYHLPLLLLVCLYSYSLSAQSITAIPPSVEAGGVDVPITIIGTGTDFIPGMTTCVEATGGFSSFTIFGEAISPTEFNALVTVPIFTPPGNYNLRIYQGPLCSGPSWTCTGCLNICEEKNIFPSVTNASCFGCADGSISINYFGDPLFFEWSNGETTQTINNLAAGSYSVTISDLGGCPSVETYNIFQPEPLTVVPPYGNQGGNIPITINGSFTDFIPGQTVCGELTDGVAYFPITGTALSPTVFNGTVSIPPDALPGSYSVALFSGPGCNGFSWGCTDCFQICIPMTFFEQITDAICVGCPNGSIDLSVFGGSFPLSYQWSNGATTQDLNGIGLGTYDVTVTDNAGCQEFASYFVGQPDPISVTPDEITPGNSNSIAIIGSTTAYIPGTTTCAEFTNGGQTYSVGGTATSELFFTGSIFIPENALPGTYDVTIYQGPACGGTSWTCYSCFTVNDPFTCGNSFTDNGGAAANYTNNSNDVVTICPEVSGEVVSLYFSSFSLENNNNGCFDELIIYDGDDTNDPIIQSPGGAAAGWCWDRDDATPAGSGDLQGETIISRDVTGCLTMAFNSNNMVTREGWEASITCSPRLTISPLAANPGESFPTTITGLGTDFVPGTTTCAELSLGAQSYFINGDAISQTVFAGDFSLPFDAPSGLYDLTIYSGPGCGGAGFLPSDWSCTQCFQVLGNNLPVEWLYFEAEKRNTEVLLSWATATETNTSHFEIEHSRDGIRWETLKNVPAAGNSDDVMNYSLLDETPFIGDNYYQVKQIDQDGAEGYSEIQVVNINTSYGYMEVRPNPVQYGDDVQLMITCKKQEEVEMVMTTINGEIVRLQTVSLQEGVNNVSLQLEDLPSGIYFIELEADQEWETAKLIKLN